MRTHQSPSLGNGRIALAAGVVAASMALAPQPSRAAESGPAAGTSTIKIAMFDFELNDTSGGSGIIPQDATDSENLKLATDEARRILAASGRYSIVETRGTADPPRSGLQDCRGCESELAKKLGAEQSMVGMVTRLNRVEHAVQIVIRDARTGTLVSNHYTGMRMGANYAWPRAVKWLMDNSVLVAQRAR